MDTLEVLDLGKFACFDGGGLSIPWRATGWRDQSDGHRIEGDELRRMVERFLILCRGKEIRVVPDILLNEIDPTGEALRRVDTNDEVMGRDVVPEPNTENDFCQIPAQVIDRLKSICAKVIADRNA
jgi:hypothetical protein